MDTVSAVRRSEIMSRVPSRGSQPEMTVRRLVHGLGYRYRLHGKGLPGRPDLVFSRHRRVIFVHGCFWHRHPGCALARMPKSRVRFWRAKLDGNRERDLANLHELDRMGWRSLIVWECELRDIQSITERVVCFLGQPRELD